MVAGPVWVSWLLSSLLGLISVSCLARLVIYRNAGSRPPGVPHWHEDVSQILMGVGMIAMFLAWLGVIPRAVWLLAFIGQALAFTILLLRPQGGARLAPTDSWQYVNHLMAGLAMAYVVLAGTATTGVIGGTVGTVGEAAHPMLLPSLAASFATYFIAYTAFSLVRVRSGAVAVAGSGMGTVLSRPRVVEGCRVVMGVGMAYMFMVSM